MKKFFLMVGLLSTLVLSACTDPDGAKKAAEEMGFNDIETGGYGWFDCGQDDFFATNFTAKNASGKPVSGVVCSGWLKGKTVRLY